ncbi:MAG: TMEM175 family protein [Candidatus Omnitrophota bacterium]|nr:TMEM175 family protein [Candidatus Omnitrophota bacterium]
MTLSKFYMNKNRLEALVDGIFAIVMTLLVMTVMVPQRQAVLTDIGFEAMMCSRFHDIFNYALSFILLAIFWIQHHEQSHFIRQTDRTHIWINIFTLLFIALFPFSTSLVNEFPERDAAELLFGVNMLIVGILFYVNWAYATKDRHLVDGGITDAQIAVGRNKCRFFLAIAVTAIILSQAHPSISADVFWLIPAMAVFESFFRNRAKS